MNFQKYFNTRQSRREVLRQLGTITAAGLALDACGTTPTGPTTIESIKHVVICCQENRTFDTYFGYYPKAGNYGIPSGYSVPDGKGGTVKPHHFHLHDTKDVAHDWVTIHKEWNNGKMDWLCYSGWE